MLRSFLLALAASTLFAKAAPTDTFVSVLGYHDFSSTKPATEMRLPTTEFRRQMEVIRQSGIRVISMFEFQAWRRGELELPGRCLLITIDDGWREVYTEAFPILKEYGYPFTLFLYTNYIDQGGRTLTKDMLHEMAEYGMNIGSHSVSHPYPGVVKRNKRKGTEHFEAFIRKEMGESLTTLSKMMPQHITPSYAYPGGYNVPEMHLLSRELGYQDLFTVIPGKVQFDSNYNTLPRYIVLGTHLSTFENALKFPSTISFKEVVVSPPQDTKLTQNQPLLHVRFPAHVEPLAESLHLDLPAIGRVAAIWNPERKTLNFKPFSPLPAGAHKAVVTWKTSPDSPEQKLEWEFVVPSEN